MKKNYCIIMNIAANSYESKKKYDRLIDYLNSNNKTYETYYTEKTSNIELPSGEFDEIIVVGGDGTFNMVINNVDHSIPLNIIKAGSINDNYTCLIDEDIKNKKEIVADIGRINDKINFFTSASFGLVVDVVEYCHKRKMTKMMYIIAMMKSVLVNRHSKFTIKLNNQINTYDTDILAILNVKKLSTIPICDGQIDDGLMELVIVMHTNRIRRILNIIQLFRGNLLYQPNVKMCDFDKIEIVPENEKEVMCIDGEMINNKTYAIEIIKKEIKLKIIEL